MSKNKPLVLNFYGVNATEGNSTPLIKALVALLNKTLELAGKSLLYSQHPKYLQELDKALWTASQWTPHATDSDKYIEQQPILLISKLHNPINASTLVIADASEFKPIENINKICILFKLNSTEGQSFFKKTWLEYNSDAYTKNFYKQNSQGIFERVQK